MADAASEPAAAAPATEPAGEKESDDKKGGSLFGTLGKLVGGSKKEEEGTAAHKAQEAADKQDLARVEAAKAKEEEKKARQEAKEEQAESARQAAKREKYQQLLQQHTDPTRRVFQMHMKAIKVENLSEETVPAGLYLKFTVGGDYSEKEEPGKGLVRMQMLPAVPPLHAGRR